MTRQDPAAVSEVRDRFSSQIKALVSTGESVGKSLTNQARRVNHEIDKSEWDGNLFDIEGIAKAFDRTENSEDVLKAISDADAPGVVGDLIASSIQGDYLATMERAFRMRHMTIARRRIHAAARRAGHGDERGVFQRGVVGTVEGILKQSKDT